MRTPLLLTAPAIGTHRATPAAPPPGADSPTITSTPTPTPSPGYTKKRILTPSPITSNCAGSRNRPTLTSFVSRSCSPSNEISLIKPISRTQCPIWPMSDELNASTPTCSRKSSRIVHPAIMPGEVMTSPKSTNSYFSLLPAGPMTCSAPETSTASKLSLPGIYRRDPLSGRISFCPNRSRPHNNAFLIRCGP